MTRKKQVSKKSAAGGKRQRRKVQNAGDSEAKKAKTEKPREQATIVPHAGPGGRDW